MIMVMFVLKFLLVMFSYLMILKFYNHMLYFLIIVEFISVINIYLMMSLSNNWFILYYMVFLVCDGVLGLGLLVMMMRMWGNEYTYNMGMLKW